jgi:hypothetical protein
VSLEEGLEDEKAPDEAWCFVIVMMIISAEDTRGAKIQYIYKYMRSHQFIHLFQRPAAIAHGHAPHQPQCTCLAPWLRFGIGVPNAKRLTRRELTHAV